MAMYAQSNTRKALVSLVMVAALAGAVVADLSGNGPQPFATDAAPAAVQLAGPITMLPELVITAERIDE